MSKRLLKLATAGALLATMFVLATSDEILAADKIKEAEKYTQDLKTSKDPKVLVTALTELGKLGQIQKALVTPAQDYMFQALENKSPEVRAAAAKSVGMIDPDPAVAVPALLKLVKDEKDEDVQIAAILGLGAMGENAKDASKDLREITKKTKDDKKSKLGKAAQNALKNITPKKK